MKLPSKYSGPGSRWFWDRVNRLSKTNPDRETECYALGCVLQDVESRVLLALHNAENEAKHRRCRKRRKK